MGGATMPYSNLVNGCSWSPNYYSGRRDVARITPHHTACVADAWTIAGMFKSPSRQASCNYAIGNDGSIVCVVDESDTAWTSSSWENDSLAITVEISDCDYDWNIGPAALEAYIALCVDLIQRYPSLGGSYDWTGDTDGNITLHNWFAATACPGPDLGSDATQSYIMQEVNRRLRGDDPEEDEVKPEDIQAIVNAIAFKGEPFNSEGMYYKGHVATLGWDGAFVRDGQAIGTEGQALRLEGIWLIPPREIGLKASAYLEGIGWTDYEIPATGGVVGTEGEARTMEALKIDADVPLRYRCHVSNIGWQEWKANGEEAGRIGERIEAFQLILV